MIRNKKIKSIFLLELLTPLLSVIILSSCEDEELQPFPDLQEGTYKIEVYDSLGNFVFSREGEASHRNSNEANPMAFFRMDDPRFYEKETEFKFAYFILKSGEEIHEAKTIDFEEDNLSAFLHMQWYILSGYIGTDGHLLIEEVESEIIKGRFTISMELMKNENYLSQIPTIWGNEITVNGYFISKSR